MERLAITTLVSWKESPSRKPLVLRGARQVGKTWLAKEFGRLHYQSTVYINFEKNKRMQGIFAEDLDPHRLIEAFQIESKQTIHPGTSLIILDEIQEAAGGLTALKYFNELAPEYHIIAAGSLLGLAHQVHQSYPVGKVQHLNLYPLSFSEYLHAIEEKQLVTLMDRQDWDLIKLFKTRFIQLLRQYYYIGGMPEAVQAFVDRATYWDIREIQNNILMAYQQDMSKHAPTEIVQRIRLLWDSIPGQLAKENRKFIYSHIKSGARAREYELAMSWLLDAGLVYRIHRVKNPRLPLKTYVDESAFKLFILDVGLLGALVDLDSSVLLEANHISREFKGSLTEQYVLQELIAKQDLSVYYWSADRSLAEVDFMVQSGSSITAIEVKAEDNLRSKSLRSFHERYPATACMRISMSDYREEDWLTNWPLYITANPPHRKYDVRGTKYECPES